MVEVKHTKKKTRKVTKGKGAVYKYLNSKKYTF